MLRIRSLVQSSANATAGSEELGANRSEIEQEIEGIVESLNTNFDGRYLFSGTNTTTAPFEIVKKMTPSSVSNTMALAKTCPEKSQTGSRWIC